MIRFAAMPYFEREADVRLHYQVHGSGFPVLLLAPGGMRSSIAYWKRAAYDPIAALADRFRLIAMDQRNAGDSRAPLSPSDGWHVYADDQLALLDHLGIDRFAVVGHCIGGAFALRLMQRAPDRVSAGVLQQPIGLSVDNRELFYDLFDSWLSELAERQPDVDPGEFGAFRERMYGGEFVFGVGEAEVKAIQTPMLVLMGDDPYHPSAISRQIAACAPHAQLIESWKEPDVVPQTIAAVAAFLRRHAH